MIIYIHTQLTLLTMYVAVLLYWFWGWVIRVFNTCQPAGWI